MKEKIEFFLHLSSATHNTIKSVGNPQKFPMKEFSCLVLVDNLSIEYKRYTNQNPTERGGVSMKNTKTTNGLTRGKIYGIISQKLKSPRIH